MQEIFQRTRMPKNPLVIGLTESGIVPSALVHQLLREQGVQAHWVCSTRRPSNGIPFTESHSHGPSHFLPLPPFEPMELWLIEDEITTGRTVLQLALTLCRLMSVRTVRFFAVADTRSADHGKQFHTILQDHGIDHSMHTMARFEAAREKESQAHQAQPAVGIEGSAPFPVIERENGHEAAWHRPDLRPALGAQLDHPPPLPMHLKGSLLVVGEAVDMGLHLVQANPFLSFRHVTLSPWKTNGKSIFKRLDILGKHYLYNHTSLNSPLFLLNDPIDQVIGEEVARLLAARGFRIEPLFQDEMNWIECV